MKATGAVPRALLAGLLTLLALLALLAPTRALPAGPVRPAGAKPDPSRENDIDFEGQVTSGEQTASSTPEMVAMVNRARGAAVDAEETIVEVQRILDKYPQLPRLSRGDILSILDNITRSAEAATTTSNPGDFTSSDTTAATTEDSATTLASSAEQGPDRQEHGRELMVVLPFNAKNLSETNIKELYTKRPLTHIIGDPTTTTKEKPTWPQRRRPAPTTAVPEPELGHELGPVYKVTEELESDAPPPEVFVSQRVKSPEKKRPLYAEQLDSERRRTPAVSTTPAPELAEDDVDYTTKRRRPESTRRPWRGTRRTTATPPTSSTSTAASQSEAVPSNHKPYYTEPTVKPWRVTTVPTTKKPIKHKPDHNLEPNKKLSTSGWTPVPVEPTKESKWKANPAPVRGTPLHDMKKAMLPATTMRPMMREDVKDLLASIGLKTGALPPKRSTLAPLSTTTTTTTTVAPVPDAADAAESLTPEMKDILMSIGLLPGKEVPVAQPSPGGVMPAMPTITTQPVVPEVDPSSYVQFKPLPIASTRDEAPHQVSEDMHEFLASFGLVPAIQSARIVSSPDEYLNMDDLSSARRSKALQESSTEDSVGNAASPEATPEMIPVEPETDPDNISYAELGNDDPLPTAASLSASLEPAAQPSGVPDVDSEALSLPPDMKQVLDSLGLPRQPKRIDSPSRGNLHSRDHIFNPVVHSAKLDDRREAEKVIKLLSSIRVLPIGPNGTQIIPEAVLAELTSSGSITTPKYGFRKKEKPGKKQETRLEDSGPNPLSTDELRLYLETAKNEVKRQEAASSSASSSSSSASSSAASDASSATAYDDNAAELPTTSSDTESPSETTPASSSTTTTSTTTTTTTTTEAQTANLDDLAESFGGDGDRPKNSGPVDTLPPARPNGLYFLFDWNTFLNVGEEGKNPVRLNFMPRIGDPKRFIEVKVP